MTDTMKEAMNELKKLKQQQAKIRAIIYKELADNDGTRLEEGFVVQIVKFSATEIADLLGMHTHTVRRWIREGKLKTESKMGPHGIQVTERQLKEFIRDNKGLFI